MQISIEFLGNQRVITRINSIDMPISAETTVNDAIEYVMRRYPDLLLDKERIVITVNKRVASLDRILNTHDTISFLPYISGG